MRGNRQIKVLMVAVLCVAVLCLSVAYAILSSTLSIAGTGTVQAGNWHVFLSDASATKSGSATCSAGTIEGTSLTGVTATFVKPGDACTVTVHAKNDGTFDAKLTDVDHKADALSFSGAASDTVKNQITYEVKYGSTVINNSTDFSKIAALSKGTGDVVITLTITFNSAATAVPSSAVTIGNLNRDFIFQPA